MNLPLCMNVQTGHWWPNSIMDEHASCTAYLEHWFLRAVSLERLVVLKMQTD